MHLRNEWAQKCQRARASALLLRLLDALFVNPFMNLRHAADLLRVNPQSAQNDINKLLQAGILEEQTGQKRNRAARDFLATEDTDKMHLKIRVIRESRGQNVVSENA